MCVCVCASQRAFNATMVVRHLSKKTQAAGEAGETRQAGGTRQAGEEGTKSKDAQQGKKHVRTKERKLLLNHF